MTLPRELSLIEDNGRPMLIAPVAKEIDRLAGDWTKVEGTFDASDAYHLQLVLNLEANSAITLSNAQGERFALDVSAASGMFTVHRTAATGVTDFSDMFAIPSMNAPLKSDGNTVTLDFFVDQSSVELFAGGGRISMTNLVFPQTIYNQLSVTGATYEAKVRKLQSVWK